MRAREELRLRDDDHLARSLLGVLFDFPHQISKRRKLIWLEEWLIHAQVAPRLSCQASYLFAPISDRGVLSVGAFPDAPLSLDDPIRLANLKLLNYNPIRK